MSDNPEQRDSLPPVHIDIERMERALAGPRMTVPRGLSDEELSRFFNELGAMMNYVEAQERERCARLADDMDYGMGELAAAIRKGTP